MYNQAAGKIDLDTILALFKETSSEIRESHRVLTEMFKETDVRFKETDAKFKETDAKFKETDAKFKETDAKMKETDRMLSEKFKETDRILSEKFKETQKALGNLGNRLGEFVEGLVIPSVIDMFGLRGIEVERVSPRVKAHKAGETMEIDIIGDNSSHVVVVEVKSKLISDDVIKFIEKLGRFKYFFPNFADKKVVGAVAGIVIDESVINFAVKQGLFVIAQKGEAVEIINNKNFTPQIW